MIWKVQKNMVRNINITHIKRNTDVKQTRWFLNVQSTEVTILSDTFCCSEYQCYLYPVPNCDSQNENILRHLHTSFPFYWWLWIFHEHFLWHKTMIFFALCFNFRTKKFFLKLPFQSNLFSFCMNSVRQ